MLNIWSVRIFTSISFIPKFFETYFCQVRPPIKDPGSNGSWGPPQHLDGHRGKIKCLSLLIWWRRSKTTIERLVVLNIYLNCITKIKWRPKKIVRCPTGLGTLGPHLRMPTVTIVGLREGFWHSNLDEERRKIPSIVILQRQKLWEVSNLLCMVWRTVYRTGFESILIRDNAGGIPASPIFNI